MRGGGIGRRFIRSPASGGSAPAAWTPASITNAAAWYRGDDVINVTGSTQTLTDKTGRGNHLDAPMAGARPLWVATGFNGGAQPYLQFNGTAHYLTKTAFDFGGSPAAMTVASIYQDVTTVNGMRVWCYGVSPIEIELRQNAAGAQYVSHFDSVTTNQVMSTPRMVTTTSSGTQIRAYVGGTLNAGPTASVIVPVDDAAFVVGATSSGGGLTSIRLAEMVVVRGVITAPELAQLAAYAAARYGVAA